MSDDAQCRQSQCYFSGCPPEYADLTDAIIIVDGAQFPVHMSVLAMRSGMLCRMLVDLRGEPANSGPLDLSTLFEGTSAPDVQLFLIHVYQAQQKIESWSEAFILAEFARKLDMTSMYDKIRGYVSEHVERLRPGVHTSAEQSLVEALILAVNHDWADVASKCETMICNNFYAVCSKTVLYTQIPPSSMQRIAVAMYNIALGEGVEWTCRCGQQNPREIRHCFQCLLIDVSVK
eukprot:TRINITY_DN27219_c0_g2_i3.p1 TRINITY_DN27219_c0_g2~~TRINITY_DN27219_c0_g2_i3.p1  ORF type:complete len:233 (-),score=7.59 TRINITY_DN27219_c0_g2_i3:55-753(-)